MKKLLLILSALCLLCACAAAEGDGSRFSSIRINEFMASNGGSLKDARGESPDWIELYNAGEEEVNLQGLCLSDGKKTLDKFVFPDWVLLSGRVRVGR